MRLRARLSVVVLLLLGVAVVVADATECQVTSHFSSQGSVGKAVTAAIHDTTEHLTLALYGFDNSDLGDELLQLVKKKIVVRLKIDTARSASKKIVALINKLKAGGVEVQTVAPNGRNHNKFAIIDGNACLPVHTIGR